jgi:hypothetical protein
MNTEFPLLQRSATVPERPVAGVNVANVIPENQRNLDFQLYEGELVVHSRTLPDRRARICGIVLAMTICVLVSLVIFGSGFWIGRLYC